MPRKHSVQFLGDLLTILFRKIIVFPELGKFLCLQEVFLVFNGLFDIKVLGVALEPVHFFSQLLGCNFLLLASKSCKVLAHITIKAIASDPIVQGLIDALTAHHVGNHLHASLRGVILLALGLPPVHCVDHFLDSLFRLLFRKVGSIHSAPPHHSILELEQLFTLRNGEILQGFNIEVFTVVTEHIDSLRELLGNLLRALPGEGLLCLLRKPSIDGLLDLVYNEDILGTCSLGVVVFPIFAPPIQSVFHICGNSHALISKKVICVSIVQTPVNHCLLETLELVNVVTCSIIEHLWRVLVTAQEDERVGNFLELSRRRINLVSPQCQESLGFLELFDIFLGSRFDIHGDTRVAEPSHDIIHLSSHGFHLRRGQLLMLQLQESLLHLL